MFSDYPDLMNIDDVQAALGIGRSMAYRLISNGDIKHMRVGRTIKVPRQYLVDYVMRSCYNDGVTEARRYIEEVVE